MAPFKKYARTAKKYYGKGKKAYNYAKKHQGTAQKALALAKSIARVVNSEVHYHEPSISASAVSTGTVYSLFDISQGDSSLTRTGSSIKLARLSGNMQLVGNSAQTADLFMRIIILRGKNERGTAPTWASVYGTASGAGYVYDQKSWNNRFNTKVLYDRTFKLPPNNDGDGAEKRVSINIKLFGHIQYTQGANTAEDGGLYMFVASNTTTNNPFIRPILCLTYWDN